MPSGVGGHEELARLGQRLRGAGDKTLLRELRNSMVKGTAPLTSLLRAAAPNYMPDGYEQTFVHALRSRTSVKTTGRTAAVDLIVWADGRSRRRRVRQMNRGVIRHKTYGRKPWHAQRIVAGFFSEPAAVQKDKVVDLARQAMHDVGQKITKG